MKPSREAFGHEPLDHTIQSIRVLQILPDLSPDGMIQCLMVNTTVESEYSCLSYVWGSAVDQRTILINGKTFDVRQNLYDFLSTLQRRASVPLNIWIDALSIDQEDTTERNHQVQQMGKIYSEASRVYLWLGLRQALPLAHIMAQLPPLASGQSLSLEMPPNIDFHSYRRGTMEHDIFENEYWERAWVTQEILLASDIFIVLSHVTLSLDNFLWALGYTTGSPRYLNFGTGSNSYELQHWTHHTMQPLIWIKAMKRDPKYAQFTRLLPMLAKFRRMQCMNTRDRVFSLLALCDEGPTIRVDYGSSHKALAHHILLNCKHALCFCSIHLIGATLSYEDWVTGGPRARGWYVEIDLHDGHLPFSARRTGGLWKVQCSDLVETTDSFPGTQLDVSLWHVPVQNYCWTTGHVLGRLRVLVSGMTNVYPATKTVPAYFTGEEIRMPKALADSLTESQNQPDSFTPELRMYANGFSFVSATKIRVSMDIVWKILADLGDVQELCDRASFSKLDNSNASFSLGYGSWNVALRRTGKSETRMHDVGQKG